MDASSRGALIGNFVDAHFFSNRKAWRATQATAASNCPVSSRATRIVGMGLRSPGLWRLANVLALVFANGFFVAAEFSIVTVRKTRIELIAEGNARARCGAR